MHVLMLSDVYFPRINGVSTSIETFRREFMTAGDQVTLLVPDYPGALPEPGIIRIPSRRLPLDPEDRLMQAGKIEALQDELAQLKIDLIHIQTPFVAHYAGIRLARQLGIPCIATYHTLFEEYFHHYIPLFPPSLLRRLTRGFSRRQCNALDGIIVPSSAMAERLQSYGVTVPLRVVPTGIPLHQFGQGNGQVFRSRIGLAPATPLALFVGRLAGEKNIDFLLHAHHQALQSIPNLHLVIAGEGPAKPHLQRLCRTLGTTERVKFVGYLDRAQDLPACYAAADVFVFASRTETQGLVLLEAMAEGVPVVALSIMGTRDILEPGRGCLSPADNPEAFADTVVSLLNDPGQRQQLAAQAKDYVREWSAAACARRLRQALGEWLQQPASPASHSPCTSASVD